MTINLLPDEIINQIAAGEVIENPSAVVKELVENSIDSGADKITVEILESGLKSIIISDNGCGIPPEDLLKAPLRHTTSKIKKFSDLYNIKTMGFRGEALASIFSIANSKIISKTKNNTAFEISSENLTIIKECGAGNGTTIIVNNLFYNTPARKKYLRSNTIELKTIVDVMMRFCICYHNINLTLKHNNKILINKPQFKNKEDNLYYVLGKNLKGKLISFENQTSGIKINGFIGNPSEITYNYVKNQYIFLNSRFIKSKIIRDAIYEGFGTNLMTGRNPLYICFIDIDPEIVDINVHPSKIEVRFENELQIFEFIKQTIQNIFRNNDTIKNFEEKTERNYNLKEIETNIEILPRNYPKPQIENNYYTQDTQKILNIQETTSNYNTQNNNLNNQDSVPLNSEQIQENIETKGPLFDILTNYRFIGLLNKTYIIIETSAEMMLIDFHAATEKITFEQLITNYENHKIKTQKLLKPYILSLNKSELLNFKENKDLITKLGYITEEFGNDEIIIREVPICFNNLETNPEKLKEILYQITIDNKFKGNETQKVEYLAQKACKNSIKAGYEITLPEIKKLIENLKTIKEPFNCPHGRPTILRFSWQDLEKKFKRII